MPIQTHSTNSKFCKTTSAEEPPMHPDPPDKLTSEVERLIEINKNISEVQAQTPSYYDLKRSPTRCASLAPGTSLRDSARAEYIHDFLCQDAHLVASIGQSRADGIPCRSAAIDKVLKAPIYWGYGQPPTNMGQEKRISSRVGTGAINLSADRHKHERIGARAV
ncbi:hypothetical protein EVAR_702_1 [Eumeta japonica]|uniref:Uncharacterized protein n=1 Tax=Eumeta variegata TaxID=151549 RepID=A0A4C1SBJ0_EUMVA|nr:hypothetical protein EVAR_702_1 [Eumeta japonica]